MYAAGVDIGNATTEVALVEWEEEAPVRWESGIAKTTGLKGSRENLAGITEALSMAADKMGISLSQIDRVKMNEAAPVIGDFAMETITETVITESTLIGHNPDTPGGLGLGAGKTVPMDLIPEKDCAGGLRGKSVPEPPWIAVAGSEWEYDRIAEKINRINRGEVLITGAVLKKDDGVLVSNRLIKKIPIVDEVEHIEKVPMGALCAVEVAPKGFYVDLLSNPYGIATLFQLNAEETRQIVPIAKALIGTRSAVVIKTPFGEIKERKIPAGTLIIQGEKRKYAIELSEGAGPIMETVEKAGAIRDAEGEKGTNVGGMIEKVRMQMSALMSCSPKEIYIRDLLAVDTVVPREVRGNIAREFSMEQAVGLAVMVKSGRMQMEKLAETLSELLEIPVEIGGIEGEMALLGALTTPGTGKPVLIVDIGAGSTDACVADREGNCRSVHLAGAGNMVNMLICAEAGLEEPGIGESVKMFPLAKAESLFHLRHEDGTVEFFEEPLDSSAFARTVLVTPEGLIPLNTSKTMEQLRQIRRKAKEHVLLANVIRAMKAVSVTGNINEFEHVVLVGGSSLDFEFGNMVTEALSFHGITSGKANVRGIEGPRNAVATGLLCKREEA